MNNTATPVKLFGVTTSVVTANENQSVREVCKLMYNKKVGSVVILANAIGESERERTGIRSHRYSDRKGLCASNGILEMFLVDIPVSEIMSKPLITIRKLLYHEAISVMYMQKIFAVACIR